MNPNYQPTVLYDVVNQTLDIGLPEDGEKIFLTVDFINNVVVHKSTGETLRFFQDRKGYGSRPSVEMVPSESGSNEYAVFQPDPEDHRTWVCTCPDFVYRRHGLAETCKHIGWIVTGNYVHIR